MADLPYRERFLHVGFVWKHAPKITELEPLFNTSLGWYRYAPNCWVLYTNNDPGVWYSHIIKHMTSEDSVLIAEVVLDHVPLTYQGWYNKGLWDWIDQRRNNPSNRPWRR
jgi:hypothetical protein